ncbi:MAG: hypothetical protein K0V04_25580 [Deltaproteobacteria bacterium]|nr:hypothetical protein [Deltaproteobacteria bacterium]
MIGNTSSRRRRGAAFLQPDRAVQADLMLTIAEMMDAPLPGFDGPVLGATVLPEMLAPSRSTSTPPTRQHPPGDHGNGASTERPSWKDDTTGVRSRPQNRGRPFNPGPASAILTVGE